MITDTDGIEARAAGCRLRRTLGAVLGGLALALLLIACEQQPATPQTAAGPSQPAPEPTPTAPVQSVCVLDVAIHQTDTGGTIQGAIKDSVLYWAGTRSDVECLPGAQRQSSVSGNPNEARQSNTEEATATYRVIRVRESAGIRYYMLKHVNGAPVCIIDETGACTRKLSALDDDYDVETLPDSVPEIGGASETPPEPPAPEPPTSGGAPASPGSTLQERYTVNLSDGATNVINNLAAFFVDPDGGSVTITNVTSSSELVATVAMVDGNLQVTPINLGTTTVTIYASSGSNPPDPQWGVKSIEISVIARSEPATPDCERGASGAPFMERYYVKRSDGATNIINNLASFFVDPEGGCITITSVTSSNELIATVAMVDGKLQVTPINLGTTTVTIYASSGTNPPDPQWGVKSIEISVIARSEPATPDCERGASGAPFMERYYVKRSDGATNIINNLASFFVDPEGGCITITSVTSSNELIATVAMVDGKLQVTPINAGTATVTIYASSGSNPPDPQWGVKSVEITVIP